jgi:phosphoglycolate phosphatase-like HAD superfamily hydrolase
MAQHLIPELAALAPELIIFDKGGTLIDFHQMWRDWIITLARRLEVAAGIPLAGRLFRTMEYDPHSGRIVHDGPFATLTMAELRDLTVDILGQAGLPRQASEAAVAAVWYAPDPVEEARPLADLPELLGGFQDDGLKVAVATVDNRAPTKATFAALGIESFVDALGCGDDGLPVKPAPDMVWAVCQGTGVDPARSIVVGDSVTDLQMGREAGAACVVAVLTGVASREALAPHADLLLGSVAELVTV